MVKNVFLIEDHDEALKIWRKKRVNGFDLVHIDAHMDLGFYYAKPIEKIFNEAKTIKELKKNLEYSLAYTRYEDDFEKQTNIGNYIYPAMEENIVNNFYWVIPGGRKEFKKAIKVIKKIIKNLKQKKDRNSAGPGRAERSGEDRSQKEIISTKLFGKRFIVCALENLPILRQKVLLDIDTDFLVIDSLLNANNTVKIGKRKLWVLPRNLVGILKEKIKQPQIITIAYSVNGGYTPIEYKHLGDEIAYHFAPKEFMKRFKNNIQAGHYFNLFRSTNNQIYYQKAIRLNSTYRVTDNNYGPLYLSLRKFSLARKEFLRILRADSENPACLLGLANIALGKKDFNKAKKYFLLALYFLKIKTPVYFRNLRVSLLFGLAKAEFGLKNFNQAKKLLIRYQAKEPLEPCSYYLLGRIFEKEKDYYNAAFFYKDSIKLGFNVIEPLYRLLRISCHVQEKEDTFRYIITKYKEFKKRFIGLKSLSFKQGRKFKLLKDIGKKMVVLEEKITKGG